MGDDKEYVRGRLAVGRGVTVKAPAKVNLHLEILRRRHDGYHEIETVLQAVSLFDKVEVTLNERYPGGEPQIQLTVAGPKHIPRDESNLCWRAARHFCREQGVSGDLTIHLTKAIPAAAGLGGGSSDAAAVLVACDRLFGTSLELDALQSLGSGLGADVPFFIRGGTALGRGIGDDLLALPHLNTSRILLIKPRVALMTSDVYGSLRMGLTVNSAKASIKVIGPMLTRFPQENWPGFNRLEDVVLPAQPVVERIVRRLQELAPVAMLSGSGSAAFGVFPADFDLTEILAEFAGLGVWMKVVTPCAGGVQIVGEVA